MPGCCRAHPQAACQAAPSQRVRAVLHQQRHPVLISQGACQLQCAPQTAWWKPPSPQAGTPFCTHQVCSKQQHEECTRQASCWHARMGSLLLCHKWGLCTSLSCTKLRQQHRHHDRVQQDEPLGALIILYYSSKYPGCWYERWRRPQRRFLQGMATLCTAITKRCRQATHWCVQASEAFLQRMMSLYVASHYRNTPNDLILMSDAPAHHLFALLGPVEEGQVMFCTAPHAGAAVPDGQGFAEASGSCMSHIHGQLCGW